MNPITTYLHRLSPSKEEELPHTPSSSWLSPKIYTNIRPKRHKKSPQRLIETIEGHQYFGKKKPPWKAYAIQPTSLLGSNSKSSFTFYDSLLFNLQTYEEVIQSFQAWKAAIDSEFKSLYKNNTWTSCAIRMYKNNVKNSNFESFFLNSHGYSCNMRSNPMGGEQA